MAFLFLFVVGKLFYVQIIQGTRLQHKAISQWTRDLTISGMRGDILDTNNQVLATSYTSFDIYARRSAIKDKTYFAQQISQALQSDFDTIMEKLSKNISEVLLEPKVDIQVAKQLLSLNLDGLYVSENCSREYPYGDFLTQVLGYTSLDNVGQAGIEAYYNQFLTGVNGSSFVESTITGVEISNSTTTFVPGIAGCSVQLTIDANIQRVLEEITQKAYLEHKAKNVKAIIMDATNGEILAMACKPSFDLNNPNRDDLQALMEYSKNLNIVDVYEPGSTFKLFTLAAALSEKVTSPDEVFYDPGYRIVDGEKIKCWRTTGHGSQTLAEALANSCNSVFMDLGLRVGKNKLYEYLQKFGIGTKTNIDFLGESSGIVMDKNYVKNVDLARISFGQAIAVTPIQMVAGVSALLNGTLFTPHFIQSIQTNDGIKKIFDAIPVRQVVTKEVSQQIATMMEGVVSTKGLYSFVPGYRILGKTGTAQKYENGTIARGKYVASFIGAYPAENPKYTLLLCVDEPSTGVYYGGVVAAPYAKEIFSGLFTYLNIEPTNLTEDMKKFQANIEVPNLIGSSITQAVSVLKSVKLEYEIDNDYQGTKIVWQSVASGEMVFEGAIIVLRLG